jgi:5-bromo-4-chloroindolyl phosphate hydrolysis protein
MFKKYFNSSKYEINNQQKTKTEETTMKMAKILSLLVLAIFVLSIVPFALAEDNEIVEKTKKTPDSAKKSMGEIRAERLAWVKENLDKAKEKMLKLAKMMTKLLFVKIKKVN